MNILDIKKAYNTRIHTHVHALTEKGRSRLLLDCLFSRIDKPKQNTYTLAGIPVLAAPRFSIGHQISGSEGFLLEISGGCRRG